MKAGVAAQLLGTATNSIIAQQDERKTTANARTGEILRNGGAGGEAPCRGFEGVPQIPR